MSGAYYAEAIVPFDVAHTAELFSPYDWHQAAWKAFAHHDLKHSEEREKTANSCPFLTRLDPLPGAKHRLLLVSEYEPKRPEFCPEANWRCRQVSTSYLSHQSYDFSLIANPTRKELVYSSSGERKKNGRRVPIFDLEDSAEGKRGLRSWMHDQAARCGFDILEKPGLAISPQPCKPFVKQRKGQSNRTVHLHRVRFDGALSVRDPEAFRFAALNGIGPGKSFGLGLLVLIPQTNSQ